MLNTGEFLILTIITIAVFTIRSLPLIGDRLGHVLSGRFFQKK
jgi:hypothetical protein